MYYILQLDGETTVNMYISRENWLFPVIQTSEATWEARTVGLLEVKMLLPSADRVSVAALWPPYLG